MKKKKCVLCSTTIGKRTCKERGSEVVCPKCCASIRNENCEGCLHYRYAEKYHATRFIDSHQKILEHNKNLERTVDDALKILEDGNIEHARITMEQLLKDHPKNHFVQYGMGVVYAFKGMYDEAILHFDKATEIFPYFIEAYYNKVIAFQKKLDITNFLKTLKKLIMIGSDDHALVQQSRRMLSDFEQHIMKKEGVDLHTYLSCEKKFHEAVVCMDNQQWEKAVAFFKECSTALGKHAQSWGNMGLCYGYLGKKELALDALKRALEIDPTYELAIINRIAIESMKDGENLNAIKLETVDYCRDYALKNKP